MDDANIVVIGGGVVGCAIARQLSAHWPDVFLLEALPKLGMGASTRNSGVIHSGLYYPQNSLKAKHCVRGNRLTFEFCGRHGVPHRKTGKLVVASSQTDAARLPDLLKTGSANGVENLHILERPQILVREPHIEGNLALEVPSSGIVSSEQLVKAYARVATENGAHIVTNAKVDRLDILPHGIRVCSSIGEIETKCLVNSAGLYADDVAALLGSKMSRHRIYPVRGEYCELVPAKRNWINGLVYPLPRADGLSLGVHLTKTLWGTVLVGPTARYIDSKTDYEHNRESVEEFASRAKALLPSLQASDLIPTYSGIRAKLLPPPDHLEEQHARREMADFIIDRDPDIPRVVHLIGIESPGLTSAPAIAEHVLDLVSKSFE